MTIATLIEKLQEDISWLGYNETEREIINHIKHAITLLKEQESLLEEYHKADGFLTLHGWWSKDRR